MTKFDSIYKDIVLDIINNGQMQKGHIRPKYADGTPAYTKYVYGVNFKIGPNDGVPILQSKQTGWKTSLKELDWIWRQMSNSVDVLNDMGVHIWDEWAKYDGTIGPAYGARLGHCSERVIHDENGNSKNGYVNQVEYIINQIKNNHQSRRIMTTLYETDYLHNMALEPCVWNTNWSVDDNGRLNLFVRQRSGDIMLGVPFNVIQYWVLLNRIAQVTGCELGTMYWSIDNAHIYDRHLDVAEKQVTADISELEKTEPKLILPESLDFFRTPLYEAKIVDYKHNGNYKYEVAI